MWKKVNLQNRTQIDFLSNRTRLMAELRFSLLDGNCEQFLFRIPILETTIIYRLNGTVKTWFT